MAKRIKPLLEAQGVGVVLTKTADNYPGLTERANISNKAKAGLLCEHPHQCWTGERMVERIWA